MADNTAAAVRVAVTGEVYNAAVGTTLPTDATSALNASFLARPLGYLTEDGITQSISEDTTEIKAWQSGDVVRKIRTSQDLSFQFALMEANRFAFETYFGNVTTATDTLASQITGDELGHWAWAIHVIDGNARLRIIIPDGQVTERGDTALVNGEPLSFPVTVTAYPVNGIKAFWYLDRDVTSS